jgi:hypothetical protein
LAINGTEHFAVSYQPTDVLLTVVSGAKTAAAAGSSGRISLGSGMGTPRLGTSAQSANLYSRPTSMSSISMSSITPARRVSALSANVPSMNQFGGSRPRANLVARGKFGGKVVRANLQFSMMNLFSKPNFSFSAE